MGNPRRSRPGSLDTQFTTLPDGRQRAVTFFKLASGYQVRTDLVLAWGGLYSAIEKIVCTGPQAHLAGLRLIGGQETQQIGEDWVWVRIYEDLPESAEIQVGKNRRRLGDDGRVEIVAEFLQLSAAARVVTEVAVTTAPAPDAAAAVLATEDAQDDGAVRRISRVYVAEGLLSTSAVDVGDGFKDVTWVSVRTRQAPTFGALRRDDVQKPNGIPVFTVTKRQSAGGGEPSSVGYSYTKRERFRAPGRLQAQKFTKNILSPGTIPDNFDYDTLLIVRDGPSDYEELEAEVTVSYTLTADVGTVTPAVWDPKKWAVIDWDLILSGPTPYRRQVEQPGYCVVADVGTPGVSERELTTGLFAGDYDIAAEIGKLFGGGNVNTVTIRGPEYPTGTDTERTRTLGAPEFRPAFHTLDGAVWYRKVQTVAVLPELPALPDYETP